MMETTFEEEKKDMSDDDEVPDDEDSVDQVDGNSSMNQDSFSRSGVQRSVVMTQSFKSAKGIRQAVNQGVQDLVNQTRSTNDTKPVLT